MSRYATSRVRPLRHERQRLGVLPDMRPSHANSKEMRRRVVLSSVCCQGWTPKVLHGRAWSPRSLAEVRADARQGLRRRIPSAQIQVAPSSAPPPESQPQPERHADRQHAVPPPRLTPDMGIVWLRHAHRLHAQCHRHGTRIAIARRDVIVSAFAACRFGAHARHERHHSPRDAATVDVEPRFTHRALPFSRFQMNPAIRDSAPRCSASKLGFTNGRGDSFTVPNSWNQP